LAFLLRTDQLTLTAFGIEEMLNYSATLQHGAVHTVSLVLIPQHVMAGLATICVNSYGVPYLETLFGLLRAALGCWKTRRARTKVSLFCAAVGRLLSKNNTPQAVMFQKL
jgi:hypothetical protein